MKTKLTLLFFFTFSILSAQNCDYDALIRDGRAFFNKSQFRPALKKFNAARTCDPSKSAEIDKEIDRVFDAIEAQRDGIKQQRDAAEEAKRLAVQNYEKLQEANKKTADAIAVAKVKALLAETAEAGKKEKEDSLRQEREKMERISRSNHNMNLATELTDVDPTLAMRIAEYNAKRHPEDKSAQLAWLNLLSDTTLNFYRKRFPLNVGPEDSVSAVAISSAYNLVICGTDLGWIKIWDLEGKEQFAFQTPSTKIYNIVFGNSGDRIYVLSLDAVRIYSLQGNLLNEFNPFNSSYITSMALSADNNYIAVGSINGSEGGWIKVIDTKGQEVFGRQLFDTSESVLNIALSSDGSTILAGTLQRTKTMALNWKSGEFFPLSYKIINSSLIYKLTYSQYSNCFYIADFLGNIEVFSYKFEHLFYFNSEVRNIKYISIDPENNNILVVNSSVVHVYDKKGHLLRSVNIGAMSVLNASISSDINLLTIISEKNFYYWNLRDQEIKNIKLANQSLDYMSISSKGDILAIAGNGPDILLVDSIGRVFRKFKFTDGQIKHLILSTDGSIIAAGGNQGICQIWNLKETPIATFKIHHEKLTSIQISPDNKAIITLGKDSIIRIWNLKGAKIHQLNNRKPYVLCITDDSKKIISLGIDSTVIVYSISGNRDIYKWKENRNVSQIESSKNNSRVLITYFDNSFIIRSIKGDSILEGQLKKGEISKRTKEIINTFGAFIGNSEDSVFVMNSSQPGYLGFWSVKQGMRWLSQQRRGAIHCASWMGKNDKLSIITAGEFGMIRIYDSQGVERVAQKAHPKYVNNIAGNNNNLTLFSIGDDGYLNIRKNQLWLADSFYYKYSKSDLFIIGASLETKDKEMIDGYDDFIKLAQYYSKKKQYDYSLKSAIKAFRKRKNQESLYYVCTSLSHTGGSLDCITLNIEDTLLVEHTLKQLLSLGDLKTYTWVYNQLIEINYKLIEPSFVNQLNYIKVYFRYCDNIKILISLYERLALIGEQILEKVNEGPSLNHLKVTLAKDYSYIGYYYLLAENISNSEKAQTRGLEIDPTRRGLLANQAHLLFFKKKFEEAKAYYQAFMNKSYAPEPEVNIPTYRDQFLKDLRAFESASLITPELRPHFDEIIQMLEAK